MVDFKDLLEELTKNTLKHNGRYQYIISTIKRMDRGSARTPNSAKHNLSNKFELGSLFEGERLA